MADDSTVDEKAILKAQLDESATDDIDPKFIDSKAKFLNGGDHANSKVEVETSSGEDSFTGLGKEELLRYANDPFWKKVRMVLFVLFWVGWVGMLVAAIVIIVLAPRCPYKPDLKWFDKQASYQIYPKSFKDTNEPGKAAKGEGVGDIKGIIQELDGHLSNLGVKTLYINSFYKSGGVDNGMDIVDYKDVEPSLGTMADVDMLRKKTKDKMRLVLDFIPNHTSKNHTWFMKSRNKEDKYGDYYVWAPCTSVGPKPTNWLSVYGESAWEYDDVRKECYRHTFLKEEPDLNLMNDDVRTEMREVLGFWLGKGFDGFYVRNAEYLVQNFTKGNETVLAGSGYDSLDHTNTKHQPETMELLQEWRALLDSSSNKPGREKVLVVTVNADVNTTRDYYGTNGKSGVTMVRTSPITSYSTSGLAAHLKERIRDHAVDNTHRKIWMLSNEDVSRIASRIGEDYVKSLLAVQMLLPGTSSSYYGDEIAMKDGVDGNMDPASRLPGQRSRDPYRSPMQWTSSENAGFTASSFTPWIPVGTSYMTNNVQLSTAYHSMNSVMDTFKTLVEMRDKESIQFGKVTVDLLKDNTNILWMTRKAEGFPGYIVIINFGDGPFASSFKEAKLPNEITQVFHSDGNVYEGTMNLSKRAINIEKKEVHIYKY